MKSYKREDGVVFNVGDMVKIVANTNNSCNNIGAIGKIIRMEHLVRGFRAKVSTNDTRNNNNNWTRVCEMELIPAEKCKCCRQELPELTEKELFIKIMDEAQGRINDSIEQFSCHAIEYQDNSTLVFRLNIVSEYNKFLKPLLVTGIGADRLRPKFETKETRIALLSLFKHQYLRDNFSEDIK